MTIEIPSRFGFIDEAAYDVNAPGCAALRREVIRNNNRLISRQGLMDGFVFPQSDDPVDENAVPESQMRGVGQPSWTLLRGPMFVRKKPGTTRGTVNAVLRISNLDTFALQIVTKAKPFDSSLAETSTLDNVLSLPHNSGNWRADYNKANIPIDPGPEEEISFYIRGGMSLRTMGSSLGTASGTGQAVPANHVPATQALYGSATAWVAGIVSGPIKHYMRFTGIPGAYFPVSVPFATEIWFLPHLPEGFTTVGSTYTIYELGSYQWGAMKFYWQQRTR